MTSAKIQHYVPKFMLRNFGSGKKDTLWAFDKQAGRSFQSNAKNVASESGFYDFEVGESKHSLEEGLSKLESQTKPVIQKLLNSDSASELDEAERATLAGFLAVQFIRTRSFRNQWIEFPKMLRAKLQALGSTVAPGSQAAELIQDPSENQIKLSTVKMINEAPHVYGPHFLDKRWFLAKTTSNCPFMLGDNPVSLQNHRDTSPYGNLGLAVSGIEIYFPLTPTRALAMWCPSLVEQVVVAARTIQKSSADLIKAHVKNADQIVALANAAKTGSAFAYDQRHVMNFNALQIGRSERYIFSSTNDFSLAEKMIGDDSRFRSGPRATTE